MKSLLVLTLLLAEPCHAVVVAIDGIGFPNTPILVNRKFGGYVGDQVDFPSGEHTLSFDGPNGYELSMRLVVGEAVTVASADASRFDDCIANRVSRYVLKEWPTPRVTRKDDGYVVTMETPVFTDRGNQGECQSESSLLTLRRLGSLRLSIASIPAGSDILVNANKVGTTNSEIVVPYTNGDRQSIQLVLRKNGFVNCLRSVALPAAGGDISAAIECVLQPSL